MSRVGFPLLLIPLAVFNIMVFLMSGVSFDAPVLTVPLLSEAKWTITVSDVLVALGILLLMLEVIRGARGKYLTDHLLSFLLLGGAAAEFLLLPQFANSTFFLLALLTLVDFFAGIALRARRPARVAVPPVVGTPAPVPEPHAPRVEPASPANSSAPAQRTEPVIVQPVVAANDSAVSAPAPQTTSEPHAAPDVQVQPTPDSPTR
ncbi:MAG: hypothetical protein J0H75_16140 [Rhizobiales bacterium]|nr:hypothetical protein [Hyphomicrobiales bacterium]